MKNILITGTSKGIGKYLFEDLKKENNIFNISGKEEIDLKDKNEIEEYCNKLKEEKIFLDIIILNAGIGEFGLFEENSLEKYEDIININLIANIRILKFLENIINKNTKIIFIGSIISKKFMKNAAVYQASKFGLRGFAGGLKSEGKKVFLINPKIVDTGFHEGKIELDKRFTETKVEDILKTVNGIIKGNEKRFEIDL